MKRLIFFVLAAFAFAACEQAPIEEQLAVRQDAPETITVGFEDDETRIQLNDAQKTVWTSGDLVSVFYKSYDNLKFEFEGNTGDRNGTLKRVGGQHNGQTMDDVVVVYPYSADYMITLSDGCVNATIPSTQTYLKGSYGVGDNLMIARSSFNQFSLKSVCGWLKIQLTGAGEAIERITFRGNDGEQVAGLVYVDATTAEATLATAKHNSDDNSQLDGTLVLDDSIYTEVTLDCGDGVALGKEATAFYIALPPQTFEQGFTVEIEDTEGYVMEQETDKALTIERNHIQPMSALEFISPATPSAPAPASNEIWYTSSNGKVVTPYNTNAFGANIVSNTYENGKGVIKFDRDVAAIGKSAFSGCNSLTNIAIPDSVTEIGYDAFYFCQSLTAITIPDSVTSIGESAFRDCNSLKAFYSKFASEDNRCLIIDSVLNSFAPADLTSYTIPDSVTKIGRSALWSCRNLTTITIPNSVTSIGSYAFYHCDRLTSITIPVSVTKIESSAFEGCSSLTTITIPDSVTSIGKRAFSDCNSLKAFYSKFASEDNRCLIIDSVLSSFAPADLTAYTIPNSVTKIGMEAFSTCSSLITITIPDSVMAIEHFAFSFCRSLTTITIPNSVTKIGEGAFRYCSNLTRVDCISTTPPTAYKYTISSWNAFDGNASGRKIYVPAGSVDAYKVADGWKDFADSIVGCDF